jgi:dCTP deaminase
MQSVALVDTDFHNLIDQDLILARDVNFHDFVQPASLDIPISNAVFLVKDKILAFQCTVDDMLRDNMFETYDSNATSKYQHTLLKHHTYMVYCGHIKLPSHLRASFSPKSSIGRIDVLVRTVVDYGEFYDCTQKGYEGDLWIQVCPRSFNIVIKSGQCLTQMMLFNDIETAKLYPEISLDNGGTHMFTQERVRMFGHKEVAAAILLYSDDEKLLVSSYHDNAQVLHLDASQGFEALETNEPIYLCKMDNDSQLFFRPIVKNQKKLTLEKDKFYILATKERISVPIELSGEMIPFTHHIGDLRSNKAGFFDSLFGASLDGTKKGTVGVLEICPHETIIIFDGQPIALLKSFQNISNPKIGYGFANNHYQSQTSPQLAKFFR